MNEQPHGPDDFHAVAWINYYPRTQPMPHVGFRDNARRTKSRVRRAARWFAFKELFASGNPRPPRNWTDHAGFLSYLHGSEYRGAFSIRNIRAFRRADGMMDATYDEVEDDSYVGFTPFRLIVPKEWFGVYGLGRGKNSTVGVEPHADRVVIEQTISFMLGKWTNLANRLLTSFWSPYAWMNVRYEVFADGSVKCSVLGSILPNQDYFRAGVHRHHYSMVGLDADQVQGFLGAGDKNDAPAWHGPRRRI